MDRTWFLIGAICGGIGVALGAFGAHGLKSRVEADLLVVFETGVRYHLVHALALLATGWAAGRWPGPAANASGALFLAGIVVFSGSLYLLALTGERWLGAVTPLGGVAFLGGWACLAWVAWRGAALTPGV